MKLFTAIKKFFKQAFHDMKESTAKQHEVDKARFSAARAESRADFEEARAMSKRSGRIALQEQQRQKAIEEAEIRRKAAEARTSAATKLGQKK